MDAEAPRDDADEDVGVPRARSRFGARPCGRAPLRRASSSRPYFFSSTTSASMTSSACLARRTAGRLAARAAGGARRGRRLVERLGDLVARLLEVLRRLLERLGVAGLRLEHLLRVGDRGRDGLLLRRRHLVAALLDELLRRVDERVELRSSPRSPRAASCRRALCASASFTSFSTSFLSRPEEDVIVIFCSLPVPRSFAETFRMPFASMSNVTSICGMPRGAGGIPTREKTPRSLLSPAISRSPWSTLISTEVWPSDAVEKTSALLRRDRRVALDELRHDAAERLDAERERRDVEEEQVLHVAREDAALEGRADRDDLVGVDALVAAPCRRSPSRSAGSSACASGRRRERPRRSSRRRGRRP